MDKKILLVDDAAFMRMLIRNTLTTNGYTNILEAADGEIAVSTYTAEKPDLVIMDITMPNKTGIEALKDIKASDPAAKVVMCSAMGQEAMVVEAIKLGALDFIVKPFKPDRILQTVQKVLDRARHARKHDWREYEFYKSQISFAARSNLEYEDGIRRLCLILEL